MQDGGSGQRKQRSDVAEAAEAEPQLAAHLEALFSQLHAAAGVSG